MSSTKIKKMSIVLYCNNNFEETKETLYSIVDQKVSHLFFDVFILNDKANDKFTKDLNKLIEKQELSNYRIFSFEDYNGLPISFNFLLKNNIIKTKYLTIIKSGDTFRDGYLNHFLEKLYVLDKDLYMNDLKEKLIIERNDFKESGKQFDIKKSNLIISALDGEIELEEALSTKPVFLGKIWKTEKVYDIFISDDKILYQDIFMYIQMVFNCDTFWYEGKFAGVVKHKPIFPKRMDKKRIELLCLTLNKTISRNKFINGQVLQLLALAIKNTDKNLKSHYFLRNHKYLKEHKIVPIYGLSKRKVLKLTKPLIEFGEYKLVKTKEQIKNEKREEKMNKKREKMEKKAIKRGEGSTKTKEFVLENESFSLESLEQGNDKETKSA